MNFFRKSSPPNQKENQMIIEAIRQALEYLDSPPSKLWPAGTQYNVITSLRQAVEQAEKKDHAERLAEKNWQYFECPACGSEGARAFPHLERETARPIYIAEVTMPEPDEIGPWCDGTSWCLNCGHEWVAVWPLGAESLECPACGSTDTDRDQAEPHKRKTK